MGQSREGQGIRAEQGGARVVWGFGARSGGGLRRLVCGGEMVVVGVCSMCLLLLVLSERKLDLMPNQEK